MDSVAVCFFRLQLTLHSWHLCVYCFCSSFRGAGWRYFIAKVFRVGHSESFLCRQFLQMQIEQKVFMQAAKIFFQSFLKLPPAANKGIAASRAGRCYLRLRFAISFGFGRTSFVGLLFVIFYFYIFIRQRLGA